MNSISDHLYQQDIFIFGIIELLGFALLLNIEVATEKVQQLKMPLESIRAKNFCFNEQKCICESNRKEIFKITLFLFGFRWFCLPFQGCHLLAFN